MPYCKCEVRKKMLALRSSLTEEDVAAGSDIIADKLVNSEIFKAAGLVVCYMNFGNEVRTGKIIEECLKMGKRVGLPLVCRNGAERGLLVYEIKDVCDDVRPGVWGILEPCGDKLCRIPDGEPDLVIVPGVAFDLKRQRLGFGAGYYDKYLKNQRPDCYKMGIAFDAQVLDELPTEAHDVKMEAVFTESRII